MLPLILALATPPAQATWQGDFATAIQRTESMVWDEQAQQLAHRHGLSLVNVTWEDTGRSEGSVGGPNISDMTIGVRDPNDQLHPMPVYRFANYTDVTADLRTADFWLRTGNEDGRSLRSVTLDELLREPTAFLHDPASWRGRGQTLWDARDTHVLVSAQACFLPIPRRGEATFTPVIYNYQSYPGDPAVLTVVATREGTSMQVVENNSGYMSEVLYFNQDGERAPFTATRLSDFQAQGGDNISGPGRAEDGLNVVLVIQVPLKQRDPNRGGYGGLYLMEDMDMMAAEGAATGSARSDVEQAVLGHGPVEGPFTEIHGLDIERDERFPVRVTVQFYQATSNGVVTDADVAALRRQIDRVYADGDYVGSLVVGGHTGRPTEWGPQPEPQHPEDAVWADTWWGGLRAR